MENKKMMMRKIKYCNAATKGGKFDFPTCLKLAVGLALGPLLF